jgi:ABC-type transport system involved in multi-copper enzyme maturation permease subunit
MKWGLRQTLVVARHECVDAFRSRRAITLILIYLLVAVTACNVFVYFLHRIENKLVEATGLEPFSEAGGATRALWQSNHFRHMMAELVGDRTLAGQLLSIPPMAIFYGWVSFMFTPFLVMLISCPRIAEEVGSASVRFVLFRTTRGTWCCGKLAGQAVLLLFALLVGAAGAWIVGWVRMPSFAPGLTASFIGWYALIAWVYASAYLGLALGVSQLSRSPVIATGIGLVAMTLLSTVAGLSSLWQGPGWRRIFDVTHGLTPGGNRMLLWHPDAAHLVPGLVILPALGLLYFSLGHAVFSRRDL